MPYLKNGDLIELIVIDNKGNIKNSLKALKTMATDHKLAAILLLSGAILR